MASSKVALKSIKGLIDKGDYASATNKAEQLVEEDKNNHTAYVAERH